MGIFGGGRGEQLGSVRIAADLEDDLSAYVGWDGEEYLVPFLPGLAFDEFLPNLRAKFLGDGTRLGGIQAQEMECATLADWIAEADDRLRRSESLPTFDSETHYVSSPLEDPGLSVELVVRCDRSKQRLWMDSVYADKEDREDAFAFIHQIVWDWVIQTAPGEQLPLVLAALQHQLASYEHAKKPLSGFRHRDIGKAPYAAIEALMAAGSAPPESDPGAAVASAGSTDHTSATATTDVGQKIRELSSLRDDGLITDEEFEAKKAEFLDRL